MSMILEILKSIVFGVVQGITEWLPISSTGHLNFVNLFMPLNLYETAAMNAEYWNMYKVVIQFGSILAVLVLYWNKLNPFIPSKTANEKRKTYRLWLMAVIATIPTGIIGLLLEDIVDEKLSGPMVFGIMLIVYGILFIVLEKFQKKPVVRSTGMITVPKAFGVGLFQSLALIPGTSRSGATILGSTLLGFNRPTAVEFSFYLAIPTMLGASLLKLLKMKMAMGASGIIVLLVGMITAFAASMICIQSLMKYVRTHGFKVFGIYRIVFGILILILLALGKLPTGFGA